MKKLRKILPLVLAIGMVSAFAACGAVAEENAAVARFGVLELEGLGGIIDHFSVAHPAEVEKNVTTPTEKIIYNNLSSALLDLDGGRIAGLVTEGSTAAYIVARNENLMTFNVDVNESEFAMMTMDNNEKVFDILNDAIKAMKTDGTLEKLIENELKVYIETDPAPQALPEFEGAETIVIGVTGDLPPMDFVSASGEAAGFNIALLTEIANRANVNIKLVQIETGARPVALSSGKVDAIFWVKKKSCQMCDAQWSEIPEATLITESYFADANVAVIPKF